MFLTQFCSTSNLGCNHPEDPSICGRRDGRRRANHETPKIPGFVTMRAQGFQSVFELDVFLLHGYWNIVEVLSTMTILKLH